MKKIIFLVAIIISCFSVSVFAEDLTISDLPGIQRVENTSTWNILIDRLNTEFDRLTSNGYTHEDYDLLSDFWTNLVINAVLPLDGWNLSDTEVREYLTEQSYIVDELERYADGIVNDPERAIFFHNAAVYANELVYAD